MSLLEKDTLILLLNSLNKLEEGFKDLPELKSNSIDYDAMQDVLNTVAERMQNNYPYFHPYYAGQMLKPPHPMARVAYMLAMWINPNNHALDGGRESSKMEKEAVAEIAKMFGWDTHLGHLCSAGTTANLEALWISGQVRPGKKIVASSQAHYTHNRLSKVLGLEFEAVPSDSLSRMDMNALKKILDKGNVGTVVATIGTTATTAIDPLVELLELKKEYGFRIHADAAYGGYFRLANNLSEAVRKVFDRLPEVDSIVVDPHKHGMQPYGCGCVLFKDPSVGKYYKHDSPYTYFSSKELHLGEISLECSRPGAVAVALWATQKLMPLVKDGEFSKSISAGRNAALKFYDKLKNDNRFVPAFKPELDIVIWAPKADSVSKASEISNKIFDEAAKLNLHLALAEMPLEFFNIPGSGMKVDKTTITALRSTFMKPDHNEWIEEIWELLCKATSKAMGE
jgi:tyrosine decarboxylase / aspartate 1-decarboxylase